MLKYLFPVLIEQDEDGLYLATAPDLKGCHTQAKTLEEIYPRIREAIGLCLEVQKGKFKGITAPKFIGIQQVEVSV